MFHIKLLLLIALVFGFSGCAQKAQMSNMAVKHSATTQYMTKYKSSIGILSVDGGKETNPILMSQIDHEEFKKALIVSLMNAGLYSKNGKYKLKVEIESVEQPSFGLDVTVYMTVKYTLLDYANHKIVFKRNITKSYTATLSDAFMGVERLKLANEGAAKENIYALLKELTEDQYYINGFRSENKEGL